jgi:FkbM family methyltransferase
LANSTKRFYGQFDPPVDKVLYEKYFTNKNYGFFIECGAYDGLLECSCKFFEESLHWNGFNIEASPRIFQRLVRNRPESTNLNIALSNKNDRATFQDIVSPNGIADGNGSLTHYLEHHDLIIRQGCSFNAVNVDTITFRDLVIRYCVKNIDLMVLDVEGHEIQVFCVEYSISDLKNIKIILNQFGYKLDFVRNVNAFFHLENLS